MSRIFINYRRQDSEGYVGRLYDHLRRHFDADMIFMDVEGIQPGADFVQVLEEAVAGCDVFLAIIGPQWLGIRDEGGRQRLTLWDDFVRTEIAAALRGNKRVIPVLVGRGQMPAPDDLSEDIRPLARRHALEISHNRFIFDGDRLAQAILDALPNREPIAPLPMVSISAAQPSPPECPPNPAKTEALKALYRELLDAKASPLYAFRTENRLFPVLGEGNADARILFIGESPGEREAECGKPFCGPSGEILDEMLQAIGLRREDVYLTNVLHDQPPTKREPTQEELAFYATYLDRLIDIIQPRIIATLGRFAMVHLLNRLGLPEARKTITEMHGTLIRSVMPYGEIDVMPLLHPAAVFYKASQREILKSDFNKLKLFI